MFEAAPQLLLSLGFIFKTAEDTPPLVVISAVFSLWSLTSKVAADDAMLFEDDSPFKELGLRKECPPSNWQYLVRVIGWRFFEISSRVCLLVLIWTNLGGLALCIILSVELIGYLVACVMEKTYVLFWSFYNFND